MLLLLKKAKYDQNTCRLIFCGDVINRGPKSLEVLKWIQSHRAEAVLGNHERTMIEITEGKKHPTPEFEKIKKELGSQFEKTLSWIKTWPFYIEGEDFIVVHAGIEPGKTVKTSSERALTSIRTWDGKGEILNDLTNPPWYDFYTGKKLVVYGHWAKKGLNVRTSTIGLDSSCVYGGHLSALTLPEKRILQIPAKKNYTLPEK